MDQKQRSSPNLHLSAQTGMTIITAMYVAVWAVLVAIGAFRWHGFVHSIGIPQFSAAKDIWSLALLGASVGYMWQVSLIVIIVSSALVAYMVINPAPFDRWPEVVCLAKIAGSALLTVAGFLVLVGITLSVNYGWVDQLPNPYVTAEVDLGSSRRVKGRLIACLPEQCAFLINNKIHLVQPIGMVIENDSCGWPISFRRYGRSPDCP